MTKLLTVAQVARLKGCSTVTVRAACRRGELRGAEKLRLYGPEQWFIPASIARGWRLLGCGVKSSWRKEK